MFFFQLTINYTRTNPRKTNPPPRYPPSPPAQNLDLKGAGSANPGSGCGGKLNTGEERALQKVKFWKLEM